MYWKQTARENLELIENFEKLEEDGHENIL